MNLRNLSGIDVDLGWDGIILQAGQIELDLTQDRCFHKNPSLKGPWHLQHMDRRQGTAVGSKGVVPCGGILCSSCGFQVHNITKIFRTFNNTR